jgi:di/tricarboxylate transporter
LTITPALSHTELRSGDVLYAVGQDETVAALSRERLQKVALDVHQRTLLAQELGLAEVLLTPTSGLLGRTLSEARFRERYGLTVLGVLRLGKPLRNDLIKTPLAFGDALLVGGGWKHIGMLQAEHKDFLVLNLPREMSEVAPARAKAPWALAIMLLMLIVMTLGWIPNVAAMLLAALAMGFSGCISVEDIYQSINWQSLVLIAGMLPLATALEKTGGLALLVGGLTDSLGELGPLALMAGLFVLTSALSQFISNTATTVLIASVAVGAAAGLSLSPYPLLMTVAVAASTAFATPVASPVNTLVLGPGGYRFNDFAKLGVPLQILVMIVTLLVVPLLFSLRT